MSARRRPAGDRPALSVLLPTYNRADLLETTLDRVLRQSFTDYEVVVSDDCSTDDTREAALRFGDARIRYHRTPRNLGYGRNLAFGAAHVRGEFLFLLGHDDLLLPGAFERTHAAFQHGSRITVVTRPYYWFQNDERRPVRRVAPFDPRQDAVLSIQGGRGHVHALFRSAGQLSGLALRRSAMRREFHHHIFTAHVYPFADALTRGDAVFLKDFTVAVRIESSMTRHRAAIYEPSPTLTWMQLFDSVYAYPAFADARRYGRELMLAHNAEGVVQIRATAGLRAALRELAIMLRLRPRNALALRFWFYAVLCSFLPGRALVRLAAAYKRRVLARGAGRVPLQSRPPG